GARRRAGAILLASLPIAPLSRPRVRAFPALPLPCGGGRPPPAVSPAVVSARALVRPYVARNALRQPAPGGSAPRVVPGPTAVVLAHEADDGTLRVGCVDSEDGAEDLVRSVEDAR